MELEEQQSLCDLFVVPSAIIDFEQLRLQSCNARWRAHFGMLAAELTTGGIDLAAVLGIPSKERDAFFKALREIVPQPLQGSRIFEWNQSAGEKLRLEFQIQPLTAGALLLQLNANPSPATHPNNQAEALLKTAEKLSKFGTWELDLNTNDLSWSDGVYLICGYEPQSFALTKEKGAAVLHPDDRERAIATLMATLQEGAEYKIQKRLLAKDGSIRHVLSRAHLTYDQHGKVQKLVGVFQDITDEVVQLEQLAEEKQLTESMLENLPVSFFILDQDGKLLKWNRRVTDILALEAQALAGKSILSLFPPNKHELLSSKIKEIFEKGRVVFEISIPTAQGPEMELAISASKVLYKGEWCILGSAFNQSETKAALLELELLTNNTEECYVLLDQSLNIVSFNQQFQRLYKAYFGIPVEKGRSIIDYAQPERRVLVRQIYERVLQGATEQTDLRIPHPGGGISIFKIIYKPAFDDQKQIIGAFVTISDITKAQLASEALAKKESELRRIFDESLDIICTIDADGRFVSISAACEHIWGYKPEALVGKAFIDFVHPEDHPKTQATAQSIMQGEDVTSFVNRYIHQNGKVVYMNWSSRWNPAEGLIFCIARDVTDKEQDMQALQESEARYRGLYDSQTNYVVRTDLEGRYTYVNNKFISDFGYLHAGDVIGNFSIQSISEHHHQRAIDTVGACMASPNKVFKVELDKPMQDGRVVTTLWEFVCLTNQQGQPTEIQCMGIDISDRIKAEKALKASNQRFELAVQASFDAIWDWDLKADTLYLGKGFESIFGYPSANEGETSVQVWEKNLYPEDKKLVLDDLQAALDNPTQSNWMMAYRYCKHNGEVANVVDRAIILRDENGKAYRMVGAMQDFTATYKSQRIEQAERQVLEASMTGKGSLSSILNQYFESLHTVFPHLAFSVHKLEDKHWRSFAAAALPRELQQKITQHSAETWLGKAFSAAITGKSNGALSLAAQKLSTEIHEYFQKSGVKSVQCHPIHKSDQQLAGLLSVYQLHNERHSAIDEGTLMRIQQLTALLIEKFDHAATITNTNERYSLVNQATNDVIYDWDLSTDRVYLAESFKRIFLPEFELNDLTYSSLSKLVHPGDSSKIAQSREKFLNQKKKRHWTAQYRILQKDGRFTWIEESSYVIRDGKGQAMRMIGVLRDIHTQKEEELRLRLLESVVTNTSDSVMISDAGSLTEPTRIVFVNDAFEKLTGYSKAEAVGKTLPLLDGPLSDANELKALNEAVRQQKAIKLTLLHHKKDGEPFWNDLSINPIFNEEGQLQYWVSIERDVTAAKIKELQAALKSEIGLQFSLQKELKNALNESLRLMNTFGQFSFSEVWMKDREGKGLRLMARHHWDESGATFGSTSQDVLFFELETGLPGAVFTSEKFVYWPKPAEHPNFVRKKAAKAAGILSLFGVPLLVNDKIEAVMVVGLNRLEKGTQYYQQFFEELGSLLGVEIKRKLLEEELERIFVSSPDVICIASTDGFYNKVNPKFCELLGYTEAEMLNHPVTKFIHPEDLALTQAELSRIEKGTISPYFENRLLTKTGETLWLGWSAQVYHDEGIVIAMAKPINEMKETQRRLIQQSTLLSAISAINQRLLRYDDWESSLQDCFAIAGEALEVDRIYYFKVFNDLSKNKRYIAQQQEWTKCPSTKSSAQSSKFQQLEMEVFGEQLLPLQSGKAVFNSLHSDTQPVFWSKADVLANAFGPIQIKNMLAGILGVDDCQHARDWQDAEKDFITTLASSLSKAIEGYEAQQATIHNAELIRINSEVVEKLLQYENWEDALRESLALMGEAVDVDRAYLFMNFKEPNDEAIYTRQVMEWTSGKASSEIDNPAYQRIRLNDHPAFLERALKKQPFAFNTAQLEGATREILEEQGIQSILQIPIFLHDDFIGYIGFDDCHQQRIWSDEEIVFLATLTTNLSVAMDRKMQLDKILTTYAERNTILESIDDGFFAVDTQWQVSYWNSKAEHLIGIKKESILNKNLWQIFDPGKEPASYIHYHQAMDTQQAVHFETFYEATTTWFEISAYPSKDSLAVYFKDVTDRKKSETALKHSNERFEKIADATQDAIWDWDMLADYVYLGKGYVKMFGYPEDEVYSFERWKSRIHPEDVERTVQMVQMVMAPSGAADTFTNEYRFKRANGTYAYVIDRGMVIRNEKGEAIRLLGAITDRTEVMLQQESLQKLNNILAARARELSISNAELEQFAFVASHDLQEPLRMITSFLSQIERKYDHLLDEKGKRYIHFAVDGARRMRQIILDLLDFSRVGREVAGKEKVQLNEVVNEVLALQRKAIEEAKAQINVSSLPEVLTHRYPLFQVFQNLVGNAIKYRQHDRPLQIKIYAEEHGDMWQFAVEDNGMGISETYFDKIFIIFQRLHPSEAYEGTGMGLAIVKKIVENLGGKVWLKSTLGHGSTFYFTIPKKV